MNIKAVIDVMRSKGMSDTDILDVIEAGVSGGIPVDTAAEKRRAYDRERKAKQRVSGGKSGGIPPEPLCGIEKEDNNNIKNNSLSPTQSGIPRKSRGTRLPDDWQPEDADRQFAMTLGFTDAQAGVEFDKFRDYWRGKAGREAAKLDWTATLRNWLRNSAERRGMKPPSLRIIATQPREVVTDEDVARMFAELGLAK